MERIKIIGAGLAGLSAAVRLAENEEEREGMRRAQRENIRRDAADSVIGYVRTQLR